MNRIDQYNKNIKLYNIYKMFAYDWLFYRAISVIFMTITKQFNMSQVMYITAIFSFSSLFWMMLTSKVTKFLGNKKSMVLGNILVTINLLFYIFSSNVLGFIIGDFIGALGFSLKSVSEGNLLYTSLKKLNRKNEFSIVEGKANSKYHYYDAISSIISGFLFVMNNYLPLILCFINLILAIIISTNFYEIEEEEKIAKNRISYSTILKSNRNKSLFLCAALFAGIVAVSTKLYSAILIDLKLHEEYITMIIGLTTLFVGVGSKISVKLQEKFKDIALSVFLIGYSILFFLIGVIGKINILNIVTLSMYILFMILMGIIQGSYRVAIKKYLLSFTTHFYRDNIISIYYIYEYFGQMIFLFASSAVLKVIDNSLTDLIFGFISILIVIFIVEYMKGKVGLRPEEYNPIEINGYKVKK